jgi:pentatricopeptide repeat protein
MNSKRLNISFKKYKYNNQRMNIKFYSKVNKILKDYINKKEELKIEKIYIEKKEKISLQSYSDLINYYLKNKNLKKVQELFNDLKKDNKELTLSLYRKKIKFELLQKNEKEIENILIEMEEKNYEPNMENLRMLFNYKTNMSFLSLYINDKIKYITYSKMVWEAIEKDDILKLNLIINDVIRKNINLSLKTNSNIIKYYLKKSEINQIFLVIKYLVSKNNYGLYFINDVLSYLLNNGFINSFMKLIEILEEYKIHDKFDIFIYNTFLNYYSKKYDNVIDFMKIVDFIENKIKIKFDNTSYNIIIEFFLRNNNLDYAYKFLKKMNDQNIIPDIYLYTIFIQYFLKIKNYNKIDQIFIEMEKNNIKPNIYLYNKLIFHYKSLKVFNKIEKILNDMKKFDIIPNELTKKYLKDLNLYI